MSLSRDPHDLMTLFSSTSLSQAVIKVVDEILSFAEAIFRERNPNTVELKDQIAKCVGIITGHLGAEAKG